MPRLPCRKFTLGDIMLLVGATAVGMSQVRPILVGNRVSDRLSDVAVGFTPILLGWTFAFFVIRLRGPRPPFRRLARQPGVSATFAATAMVAVWSAFIGVQSLLGKSGEALDVLTFSPIGIGPAVLGAWIALYLGRSGRPERGWIDRAGVAIGALWVILMLGVFRSIL